jgi:hypothetical protein
VQSSERIVPEHSDDLPDILREYGKRWKQTFSLKLFRLAERYIRGDTHLFVRFMIPFEVPNYVSSFQCRGKGESVVPGLLIQGDTTPASLERCSEHESVFVDDVKLMEPPQEEICSSIRTEPINDFLRLWGHTICFSIRFGFIDLFSLTDREIYLGIGETSASHRLTGQMIQGGPEIVGSVSEQQRDVRRNVGNALQDELRAIRFSIELGDTEIRVRTKETNPCLTQIVDVLFGSFNLEKCAKQI